MNLQQKEEREFNEKIINTAIISERNRILNILDKDITEQRNMIRSYPQHKKSIEWRIIGMKLLMERIKTKEVMEE